MQAHAAFGQCRQRLAGFGGQLQHGQIGKARELAGDFASTLVSGLRNGEGLWKSLGKAAISVLTKISDRLLNDVLNSL